VRPSDCDGNGMNSILTSRLSAGSPADGTTPMRPSSE
jgi:hypothetical protein